MILCFTGPLGSGKTYGMIDMVYEQVRISAQQVYTNMRSLHFPESVYMSTRRLESLVEIEQGLLLLDEAHVMMDAYFWQKIPDTVLQGLTLQRKAGIDLFFTTQHISQVATRLRNLVNDEVYCCKIGNFLIRTWRRPGLKKAGKRQVTRLRPRIWRLYDTYEMIGNSREVKIPQSEYLAAVRAARGAQRPRRAGRGAVPPMPYYAKCFRWYDRRGSLTPEAQAAYEWLVSQRLLLPGYEDWLREVEKEVSRRRWLSEFGLTFQDVPSYCRYDRPWMYGYTPAEVEQDVTAQLMVDEAEKQELQLERKAAAARAKKMLLERDR